MDYKSRFWNSKEIVKEFTDTPAQDYWIEFFNSLRNKETKKVLDMGCGGGRYTEILCKLGFQVSAFDLYDRMLQATAQRLKGVVACARVVKADMTQLPFEDSEFDLLLSNGLFHNAEDKKNLEQAILEASRILRDKGLLCLNMFYDSGRNTNITRVAGDIFITQDNLRMTLLKRKALLRLLEKCSFKSPSTILFYDRKIFVGVRSVLRGVFEKN